MTVCLLRPVLLWNGRNESNITPPGQAGPTRGLWPILSHFRLGVTTGLPPRVQPLICPPHWRLSCFCKTGLAAANRLAALSGESDVIYISSDRNLRGFLTNSAPAVNAPYAWSQSLEGSGISVAVFDSGIGLGATRTSAGLGR